MHCEEKVPLRCPHPLGGGWSHTTDSEKMEKPEEEASGVFRCPSPISSLWGQAAPLLSLYQGGTGGKELNLRAAEHPPQPTSQFSLPAKMLRLSFRLG